MLLGDRIGNWMIQRIQKYKSFRRVDLGHMELVSDSDVFSVTSTARERLQDICVPLLNYQTIETMDQKEIFCRNPVLEERKGGVHGTAEELAAKNKNSRQLR